MPATPLSTVSLPLTSGDLRLDAWVDDSRVVPGQQIRFRLAVHNVTDEQINAITLKAFETRGFTLAAKSRDQWTPDRGMLCDSLPSKNAFTAEATLNAGEVPGRYGIGAVVEWTTGSVARWKAVTLSPITIENVERHATLRALKTLTDFLKDFALPIVLAVIAYRLKKAEDKREDERKTSEATRERERKEQDEKRDEQRRLEERERDRRQRQFDEDRAAERRAAEERRAQVQQTWTLMLPKMHDNSERYYMPLMTAAWSVAKYYEGEHENQEVCFFFYVVFLAHMKQMIDRISGFYLRDRAGEDVVSTIWILLLDRADDRFTRRQRELTQIAVLTRPNLTYAEFEDGPAKSPAVTTVRSKFLEPDVFRDFAVDVKLFRLFYYALTYEVNRSYQFWYVEPEEFPSAEWKVVYDEMSLAKTVGLIPDKEFSTLIKALDSYAVSLTRRARDVQSPEPAILDDEQIQA